MSDTGRWLVVVILLGTGGTTFADALTAAPMVGGFEEPLIPTRTPTVAERLALDATVARYTTTPEDFTAFEHYLADAPDSPWRAAIETNLGLAYYRTGRFTPAIASLEAAWRDGRHADGDAKALVDRAIGELVRMHARLGHADRVAALLTDIGDRPITGSASEAVAGAREGLWLMRNDPGVAYLCGPMALRSLAASVERAPTKTIETLDAYRSGSRGVSLGDVAKLARAVGLPYRPVVREDHAAIPVPSVVHWKLDHYAAIVAERDGYYLVQDPTFGSELWLDRAAIDAESSGYFLARDDATVASRTPSAAELASVHGMGNTTIFDTNGNGNGDPKTCGGNTPMCTYSLHLMLVSLSVNDTPVGYAPPRGPALYTTLTYSQRETHQPAVPTYFNFGPKWTSNWLTYVVDDPRIAGANVTRYAAGGGGYDYVGYDKATGAFTPETTDLSVLVRLDGDALRYERRLGNGAKEIYGFSDRAAAYPRRFFLSELVDARGNRVAFAYDDKRRLMALTDATGRVTTFAYEHKSNPLLVTSVTDPFGRSAKLAYDSGGRLVQITDVIGITSSFTYDAGGFMTGLVTPYGITRFAYTEAGVNRTLEATDPMGFTERIEFRHNAPGVPAEEKKVPAGMNAVGIWQQFRNTFYWDKVAYKEAPNDYTKALMYHWFHKRPGVAGRTIESIKPPLESRIWFDNPGTARAITGTYDVASAVGRLLDDGTSQVSRTSYNDRGNVTGAIDPVGRTTALAYAPNGIDVTTVAQAAGPGEFATLAQYTYDNKHLPVNVTDAAGQTSRFTYNDAGQPVAIVDPLGNKTSYEYDELGYLQRVVNANGKTASSFTYDSFGRVATATDADGFTIASAYDALDRPTKVTYPDGTSQSYEWNRLDLVSVTDRAGRKTAYEYDAVRNRTAIVDPLGRRVQFSYYPNGTLESVTDAAGHKTTWQRDIQGRVTGKVFADGSKYVYVYEPATSRLKSVTDAIGQTKTFVYTTDDRLAKTTYSNAAVATSEVSFTFDRAYPRLSSLTNGSGTIRYEYAPIGTPGAMSLARELGPRSDDAISYTYDAGGRLATRTLRDAEEVWQYDALGRVREHRAPLGDFMFEYIGQTPLLARRTSGAERSTLDLEYGPRRDLVGLRNSGSRGFQLVTNAVGQIERITERNDPPAAVPRDWRYEYDADGRLLSAMSAEATETFRYDANDNLLTGDDVRYDAVNRPEAGGGAAPTAYDANGNIVNDGARKYSWDAENRLVRIDYADRPGVATTFDYDARGRRSVIAEVNGEARTETYFNWCGGAICEARSADGTQARHFYPEGEVDVAAGAKSLYLRDHIGSVRNLIDVASGDVRQSFDYSPFGGSSSRNGDDSSGPRFAGMFYHAPSGLYLTWYRAYDPVVSRWLSRDPLGEFSSLNLYSYVGGDPIGRIDPLGLSGMLGNAADVFEEANHGIRHPVHWFNFGPELVHGLTMGPGDFNRWFFEPHNPFEVGPVLLGYGIRQVWDWYFTKQPAGPDPWAPRPCFDYRGYGRNDLEGMRDYAQQQIDAMREQFRNEGTSMMQEPPLWREMRDAAIRQLEEYDRQYPLSGAIINVRR